MPATRTRNSPPRDVSINLRANRRQGALIDRAAEALGKNRSDFMLGRLAVDRGYQSRGLGAGLLRDAILRVLHAAEVGGICAILVHAVSEEAKRFYERHGFVESPIDPMTPMITVADAKRVLGSG